MATSANLIPLERSEVASVLAPIAGDANLYTVGLQLAARAPSASSRKQYATIYKRFTATLAAELGRPPLVSDLTADVIAGYARHLETVGGRGGRPAALSTRRLHLTMLRALAAQLGRKDVASAVGVPSHRVGPPETLTDLQYGNLLRAPDRRTTAGRRDHVILRVLGDCGLRNAELRALTGRSLRRPRANSRHWSLYVFGKGGTEREVPLAAATKDALDAWLASHPLADRQRDIRDADPLFIRLGRHGDAEPGPLSNQALNKLLTRYAALAGIPERLQHPHVLRAYYATTLVNEGVPVHITRARLGHQSVETTMRYLAELEVSTTQSVGEILDRRHDRIRRGRPTAG